MKIICTCGTETPIYKIEDTVFEYKSYSSLEFPEVECGKCGKQYKLTIRLDHVKTNPKITENPSKLYCEKYHVICSSSSCADGTPIMSYSITAPRGAFREEFGDPYALIKLPDGRYKEVEPVICVCEGCEDAKRFFEMKRGKQ